LLSAVHLQLNAQLGVLLVEGDAGAIGSNSSARSEVSATIRERTLWSCLATGLPS